MYRQHFIWFSTPALPFQVFYTKTSISFCCNKPIPPAFNRYLLLCCICLRRVSSGIQISPTRSNQTLSTSLLMEHTIWNPQHAHLNLFIRRKDSRGLLIQFFNTKVILFYFFGKGKVSISLKNMSTTKWSVVHIRPTRNTQFTNLYFQVALKIASTESV